MVFSALTLEKLGWYVDTLSDPRDRQVFYVGKGRANRCFQHSAEAKDLADHPELQSAKHQRILAIEASGETVQVNILRHAIDSERQAYVVESAAIDLINQLQPKTLLNVLLGHHHAQHGLMDAGEVEVLYAAPESPPPMSPMILVSLNSLWTPTATGEALREMTTGWWIASGVMTRKPTYILGIHNGVVRSVYRPGDWRRRAEGDRGWTSMDDIKRNRWGCEGLPAPEMEHWIGTNVKRFLTAKQWSVRYIG
jgi:hypothetical protein